MGGSFYRMLQRHWRIALCMQWKNDKWALGAGKSCVTFLAFIRVASRRVPPTPRKLDKKEIAGLLGPTKNLGVKFGRPWPKVKPNRSQPPWAQLGRNLRHVGQLVPTWAQLEPSWGSTRRNLGTFGPKLGLICTTWSCVGASGSEVGRETSPMWATCPCTNLHHSKKTFGNSFKHENSQLVAYNPQNWPGLGLLRLAPNSTPGCRQLVMLDWSWAQRDPKLKLCVHGGPGCAEHGATSTLAPSRWAHQRHNIGNIAQHVASSMPSKPLEITMKTGFQLGGHVFHIEAMWTSTCAKVARKRLQLGVISCAILEPKWAEVGAKWSKLGGDWDLVGRSWIQVDVAAMSDRNIALGRCLADLQNVQISNSPRALVGGPLSEHPPPQLKLYQVSRSVPCFDSSWTITPRRLPCGGFPALRSAYPLFTCLAFVGCILLFAMVSNTGLPSESKPVISECCHIYLYVYWIDKKKIGYVSYVFINIICQNDIYIYIHWYQWINIIYFFLCSSLLDISNIKSTNT